jgi:hypothetical protein
MKDNDFSQTIKNKMSRLRKDPTFDQGLDQQLFRQKLLDTFVQTERHLSDDDDYWPVSRSFKDPPTSSFVPFQV